MAPQLALNIKFANDRRFKHLAKTCLCPSQAFKSQWISCLRWNRRLSSLVWWFEEMLIMLKVWFGLFNWHPKVSFHLRLSISMTNNCLCLLLTSHAFISDTSVQFCIWLFLWIFVSRCRIWKSTMMRSPKVTQFARGYFRKILHWNKVDRLGLVFRFRLGLFVTLRPGDGRNPRLMSDWRNAWCPK